MSRIIFRESAAPTTPASGQMTLFADTNGDLSWLDDGGNLTKLVTTGAATITLPNATDTIAVLGTQQTFTGQKTFNEDIVMANTKGISFDATGQGTGTMTSEVFSDYEEGTWTPTYTTTGTNLSSVVYVNTSGFYTKIGRVVHVQGTIRTSSLSTVGATGDVVIGNLPFTANSTADRGRATGSIGFSQTFATNRPNQAAVENNTTYIRLSHQHGNVNSVALVPSDLTTGSLGNYVFFSATYTT